MGFTVFDPTDGPVAKAFTPAPRLASLAGKVIGILDNGKTKSDLLLREIQNLLCSEAGVAASSRYGSRPRTARHRTSSSMISHDEPMP